MFQHTVSIAAGLNVVVRNDHGDPVDAIFVPFSQLLLIYLPAGLYTLFRLLVFGALGLWGRLVHTGESLHQHCALAHVSREARQWWVDLQFIGQAGWLLVRDRRFSQV
jgi:hypothetical protein